MYKAILVKHLQRLQNPPRDELELLPRQNPSVGRAEEITLKVSQDKRWPFGSVCEIDFVEKRADMGRLALKMTEHVPLLADGGVIRVLDDDALLGRLGTERDCLSALVFEAGRQQYTHVASQTHLSSLEVSLYVPIFPFST